MKKQNVAIITTILVFILLTLAIVIYYYIPSKTEEGTNTNVPVVENNKPDNTINVATEGNDMILKTSSDTSIRVINEFDINMFTAKKNLVIMFGSWCEHCQEEIQEIGKIIKYYEKNPNVNIIVVAHEFSDTIPNLISLVENDVDFGKREVYLDLERVIRATLDPEASTVPVSYVVDSIGNVLGKHSDAITLDIAKDMLK